MLSPLRLAVVSLAIAGLTQSCALITTPVKVVGKAATTTIDVTGKAAGAGFRAIAPDDKNEKEEEKE